MKSSKARVPLAITMGDPGGIGPEIVLRALNNRALRLEVQPILVGDRRVWLSTAERLGLPLCLADISEGARRAAIAFQPSSDLKLEDGRPGPSRSTRLAAVRGEAAYGTILAAVDLCKADVARALVTAPISKANVVAAGHDFPGHTELLAHLCGDVPVRMMMVGSRLRVALVTIHVALKRVSQLLRKEKILETISLLDRELRTRFSIASPRLVVAGLNPHAGEGGLFGDEEAKVIAPAIKSARRRGIDVTGPVAADGAFPLVADGYYDAIVCMYHDQGLAPFKLLHFSDGVNFTAGLPFVRTSPDHGTAFDIAGTGKADPGSMIAAIRLAAMTSQSELHRRSSLS